MLLHPDKSQYLCPLLASSSVPEWIFFWLVQCFDLCSQSSNIMHLSASLNQYGSIMLLWPNTHQTVTFSTWNGQYWWSWAWSQKWIFCSFTWPIDHWGESAPRHWKNRSRRNQDGLRFAGWCFAKRYVSQPYLHRSKVIKSVFYMETGEYSCALYTELNSLKDLSHGTNVLRISLETVRTEF